MGDELLDCLPLVDNFAFTVDLDQGSLIIGIVEIFLPFFLVIYHLFGHYCNKRYSESGLRQYVNCSPEWASHTWIVLYIVYVISAIFVIWTYLIKRLKGLLFLAVCIQLALIATSLILTAVLFIVFAVDELYVDSVVTLLLSSIILAMLAYFVVVLYSWYKSL